MSDTPSTRLLASITMAGCLYVPARLSGAQQSEHMELCHPIWPPQKKCMGRSLGLAWPGQNQDAA